MTVKISRRLNIVLPPVEGADGAQIYIHSMPVGRSVFEQCYRSMARAMAALVSEGVGPITGPSVAKLYLQTEADSLGESDKISNMLLSEIKRLTNVAVVGPKNEQMPYVVALQRGLIDEDQASEVENNLVYFTLVSWVRLPDQLSSGMGLEGLRQLWKAQTTSLDITAYIRGLPTSTPVENTGAKTAAPAPAPSLQPAPPLSSAA